jgi:hypothetical protein
LQLIPPDVQIYRTYPGPLHRLAYRHRTTAGTSRTSASRRSLLDPLKAFLIPDPAIEWLPFALAQARRLLKAEKYQLIVSSGYPFSCHLLGYLLKRLSRLPWVADSGDPWAFNLAWRLPAWRRGVDKRLEAHLLRAVDRLILTTEAAKADYLSHYRCLTPNRVVILSSGYDPAEYAEIPPEGTSRFRLVYTGRFYAGIREPRALFAALAKLDDLDFEVLIAGEKAMQPQLPRQLQFLGFVPRRRALALQKGAAMLLFLGNRSDNPMAQLPAKLFEYVAAGRPILAIRYDADDLAARLIHKWKRGLAVDNEPEAIAAAIREAQTLWSKGKLDQAFELGPRPEYTWEHLGTKLDEILRTTVQSRG